MSWPLPLSSHGIFDRLCEKFGVIERISLHNVLETHFRTQLAYLLVVRQHCTITPDGEGKNSSVQPHGNSRFSTTEDIDEFLNVHRPVANHSRIPLPHHSHDGPVDRVVVLHSTMKRHEDNFVAMAGRNLVQRRSDRA
jgi:hypothetical protein